MRLLTQRLYLLIKEVLSVPGISAIVFFSVLCSALVVGVFDIAGENVNRYIVGRFAGSVPPNTIKVSPPPRREMPFLQVETERRGIGEAAAARIVAMKGVASVEPVLPVEAPMQGGVDFFGFGYRIDLTALGVPASLVKDALKDGADRRRWNRAETGGLIPVVVPKSALQAYNEGMAGPNGLPRISERTAKGVSFRLFIGRSSLRSLNDQVEAAAVITGFTDRPGLLALLIPITIARDYNRRFRSGYRTEYLHLYVTVKDHRSLIRVRRAIAGMGLSAETGVELSENILRLQRSVSLSVAAMKTLIIILSAVAVAFSTVIATISRVEYYRIVRIVGGSKLFIGFTVLVKYGLIGAAGSLCAAALLERASETAAAYLSLPGLTQGIGVSEDLAAFLFRYGVLLPVLSAVPSLARLYTRGLGGD